MSKDLLEFYKKYISLCVQFDPDFSAADKTQLLTRKFDVRKLTAFDITTEEGKFHFAAAIRNPDSGLYDVIQEHVTWTLEDGSSSTQKIIRANDGSGRYATATLVPGSRIPSDYSNKAWRIEGDLDGVISGFAMQYRDCNVADLESIVAEHNASVPRHNNNEFAHHSTSAVAIAICGADVEYLEIYAAHGVNFDEVVGHGYRQPYNAVMMASDPGSHLSGYGVEEAGLPQLDAVLEFLADKGVNFDYSGPGGFSYYANRALFLFTADINLKSCIAQSLIKHGANPFIGGSAYDASQNIIPLKAVLESADSAVVARIEEQFVQVMSNRCAGTKSGNAERTKSYLEKLSGRFDATKAEGYNPYNGGVAGTHLAEMANALLDSGILVDAAVSREALLKVLDLGAEAVAVAAADIDEGAGVGAEDEYHSARGAGGGIGPDGECHYAGAHLSAGAKLVGADASTFAADGDHA